MLRRATVLVCGSSTQTAGAPWVEVRAEFGISMPATPPSWMLPVTVEPRRMAAGGLASPTRTWKVRVTGSAWGATSRTRPMVLTLGSLLRATVTSSSAEP